MQQPHEQPSGNAGVATRAPWAFRVDTIDFDGDGAADIVMTPPPVLPGRMMGERCNPAYSPRVLALLEAPGAVLAEVEAERKVGS